MGYAEKKKTFKNTISVESSYHLVLFLTFILIYTLSMYEC